MQRALKPKLETGDAEGEDPEEDTDAVAALRGVNGYKAEFGVGKNWKVYDGDPGNEHFVDSGYSREDIDTIWNAEKKYQDRIISIQGGLQHISQ